MASLTLAPARTTKESVAIRGAIERSPRNFETARLPPGVSVLVYSVYPSWAATPAENHLVRSRLPLPASILALALALPAQTSTFVTPWSGTAFETAATGLFLGGMRPC